MKKLFYISILSITALVMSCKKENSSSNDIVYKQLNLSASHSANFSNYQNVKIDNIPITGEIGDEMDLEFEANSSVPVPYKRFSILSTNNQQITSKPNTEGLIPVAINSVIDENQPWGNSGRGFDTSFSIKGVAPGSGDNYIGIRVKLSDNTTHYGWMSLNFSADSLTVTVKEVAYKKKANESIKAGEK